MVRKLELYSALNRHCGRLLSRHCIDCPCGNSACCCSLLPSHLSHSLVSTVSVRSFPLAGSDWLNHSHPWIESGSVARHRMVRFLILLACRLVGRPSSTRHSRDIGSGILQTRVGGHELLVLTKRAAITLISHSIGGDAIVVVICLVDMHRVTVLSRSRYSRALFL